MELKLVQSPLKIATITLGFLLHLVLGNSLMTIFDSLIKRLPKYVLQVGSNTEIFTTLISCPKRGLITNHTMEEGKQR